MKSLKGNMFQLFLFLLIFEVQADSCSTYDTDT